MERKRIDLRTPEGIYQAILLETDNVELAEQAKTEAAVALKLNSIANSPLPTTVG